MALTKVSNDLITDSTIAIGKLNTSGTASSSVALKGDFSWAAAASTSGKWSCAASAPGSPTAGDIWYTGGKIYIAVGTDYSGWNSGPNCNNAAQHMGNAGTTSAGLTWGGHVPGGAHNKTEEFNGTAWSQVNNMLTDRNAHGSSGTQTAALSWAGLTPSISNATHEYDGTSWATSGNFPQTSEYPSGFGTQSNTTSAAGAPYSTNCYEYNGSSWSTGGTRATAAKMCAGSGATGSAGLVMGGYHQGQSYINNTEEYNGTAWSAGGDGPYPWMSECGTWGTLTATVGCGGYCGVRDNDVGIVDWAGIYDGTAWSAAQTMITIKSGLNGSGIGSTSSGMITQGYSDGRSKETCEEFSSNIGIWYTKEVGYT